LRWTWRGKGPILSFVQRWARQRRQLSAALPYAPWKLPEPVVCSLIGLCQRSCQKGSLFLLGLPCRHYFHLTILPSQDENVGVMLASYWVLSLRASRAHLLAPLASKKCQGIASNRAVCWVTTQTAESCRHPFQTKLALYYGFPAAARHVQIVV
jgi:hypothetical protein